jgi:hypothetical protein
LTHSIPSDPRFLSEDEKKDEVATWNSLCQKGRPEGEIGGRGYPDPEMIPWCAKLNAIRGVCTLQSCAGHRSVHDNSIASPGKLWIRLDPVVSALFDTQAFRLSAKVGHIEEVARLYASWGKEIASITFAGNERDSLNDSMRLIVAFFHQLRVKGR